MKLLFGEALQAKATTKTGGKKKTAATGGAPGFALALGQVQRPELTPKQEKIAGSSLKPKAEAAETKAIGKNLGKGKQHSGLSAWVENALELSSLTPVSLPRIFGKTSGRSVSLPTLAERLATAGKKAKVGASSTTHPSAVMGAAETKNGKRLGKGALSESKVTIPGLKEMTLAKTETTSKAQSVAASGKPGKTTIEAANKGRVQGIPSGTKLSTEQAQPGVKGTVTGVETKPNEKSVTRNVAAGKEPISSSKTPGQEHRVPKADTSAVNPVGKTPPSSKADPDVLRADSPRVDGTSETPKTLHQEKTGVGNTIRQAGLEGATVVEVSRGFEKLKPERSRKEASHGVGLEKREPKGDRLSAGNDRVVEKKPVNPGVPSETAKKEPIVPVARDSAKDRHKPSRAVDLAGKKENHSQPATPRESVKLEPAGAPGNQRPAPESIEVERGALGVEPAVKPSTQTVSGSEGAENKQIIGDPSNTKIDPTRMTESDKSTQKTLDTGRVFRQVQDSLRQAFVIRPRAVSVKLVPESLGEMNVRVRLDNDLVKAEIETESRKVAAIIRENQSSLEQKLREQGVELDRFEVRDREESREERRERGDSGGSETRDRKQRSQEQASGGETHGTDSAQGGDEEHLSPTDETRTEPEVVAGQPFSFTV